MFPSQACWNQLLSINLPAFLWLIESILHALQSMHIQGKQHRSIGVKKRCCSQWQPTFCLVETIFSHSHFWEALLQLEGGRYFLKNLISVRGNHFREIFSDTDWNGSCFLVQWNYIFQGILHSGKRKRIFALFKLCAFFRSFFLLVDNILEIRCKPVFFNFFMS